MILTSLHLLLLLKGLVSCISTVSPSLHSLFSSCAVYFFVFKTNLPYIGCFILIVSLTTIVFSILLLETTPILSFLKFLSIVKMNYCCFALSSVSNLAMVLLKSLIWIGFSTGLILCANFVLRYSAFSSVSLFCKSPAFNFLMSAFFIIQRFIEVLQNR